MKTKNEQLEKMTSLIVPWYQKNKRMLPWRVEKNPYFIWISEIMLQQTRIEAVKEYYDRFLNILPTIQDLANIEEERLLKLWEGLGYYNRARNLKKAAQIIVKDYQGKMPTTYEELIGLPGIGEYTAGAISSIAFDEKVPAVDGNVLRVVARVIGSKEDILDGKVKKEITKKLQEIMPTKAGDFNEGIMELGEVICVPNGKPLCERCPLKEICDANKQELTDEIPVRVKKVKRRQVEKTVFLLVKDEKVAIQKREKTGLLAGFYEFPNVEKALNEKEIKIQIKTWGLQETKLEKVLKYHHIFSHIEWEMQGYLIEVTKENDLFLWVDLARLWDQYPIPGAYAPFREQICKKKKD